MPNGAWVALIFEIPFDCAGCDNSVSTAHVWCADCVTHVATFDNQHAVIDTGALPPIAAYDYAGPVKHAIHRFKFNGRSDLAGRLARDVARAVGHYPLPSNAVLVPVPLTPQRLVERGYNQAALLANAIARQLRLRHFPLALRRVHDGSHQVGANKVANAPGKSPLRSSQFLVVSKIAPWSSSMTSSPRVPPRLPVPRHCARRVPKWWQWQLWPRWLSGAPAVHSRA